MFHFIHFLIIGLKFKEYDYIKQIIGYIMLIFITHTLVTKI